MLLAFDTTSPPGSLALLLDDGTCLGQSGDGRPYDQQLPAAAVALVAGQGRSVRDIDVFAVATGPGSLTGLRVGMATVQGLAFATGRPCVGVSVFDALAWAWLAGPTMPAEGACLGVWLDARRDEVFTALVRRTAVPIDQGTPLGQLVTTLEAPAVGTADERVACWRALPGVAGGPLAVCGTRAMADRDALASLSATVSVVDAPADGLAAAVAAVAARAARAGHVVGPHALHPLYVRRPDVEVARDRARAGRVP